MKPYPSYYFSTRPSTLTVWKHYSFEDIFLRSFKSLCTKNDILIAISTSGNSKNVLKVLKYAQKQKLKQLDF